MGGRKHERRQIAQYPPARNALAYLRAVQVDDGEIHFPPRKRGGVCQDVADVEVAMVHARPVQGMREVGDRIGPGAVAMLAPAGRVGHAMVTSSRLT